ncbi:hypothetical protein R3P38DRAFT_3255807 [Favolaschia claudopus]|uniref:Uncharacterized protein n=1 Tax=Favolaschia claudopus TaxID=2862362 RepID=A0AAW0DN96_9AGAR
MYPGVAPPTSIHFGYATPAYGVAVSQNSLSPHSDHAIAPPTATPKKKNRGVVQWQEVQTPGRTGRIYAAKEQEKENEALFRRNAHDSAQLPFSARSQYVMFSQPAVKNNHFPVTDNTASKSTNSASFLSAPDPPKPMRPDTQLLAVPAPVSGLLQHFARYTTLPQLLKSLNQFLWTHQSRDFAFRGFCSVIEDSFAGETTSADAETMKSDLSEIVRQILDHTILTFNHTTLNLLSDIQVEGRVASIQIPTAIMGVGSDDADVHLIPSSTEMEEHGEDSPFTATFYQTDAAAAAEWIEQNEDECGKPLCAQCEHRLMIAVMYEHKLPAVVKRIGIVLVHR